MGVADNTRRRTAGHVERNDFRTIDRVKTRSGPEFEGSAVGQPRIDAREYLPLIIASQ